MNDTINVLEEAFKEQADGRVIAPDRTTLTFTEDDGWVGIMPAYIGSLEALSVKFVTIYRKNMEKGLPTLSSTILLSDPKTGEVKSVMDGSFITGMRTGGLGGLAAKYLSKRDAHSVGIFGAGAQGRTQLMALEEVRAINSVMVYDPIVSRAESFSEEMSKVTDMPIKVSTDAAEIVGNSDIIVTVSTSKDPVFDGKDILPGTHINAFGNYKPNERELDSETVKRSKIFVDQRSAAMAEAGDLLIPMRQGIISENDILADIGEIVTGRKSGRMTDSDVTLFKSVGLAIQDCAASSLAYKIALKKGIGTEIDLQN
jgi:alanine dehydrogenase